MVHYHSRLVALITRMTGDRDLMLDNSESLDSHHKKRILKMVSSNAHESTPTKESANSANHQDRTVDASCCKLLRHSQSNSSHSVVYSKLIRPFKAEQCMGLEQG